MTRHWPGLICACNVLLGQREVQGTAARANPSRLKLASLNSASHGVLTLAGTPGLVSKQRPFFWLLVSLFLFLWYYSPRKVDFQPSRPFRLASVQTRKVWREINAHCAAFAQQSRQKKSLTPLLFTHRRAEIILAEPPLLAAECRDWIAIVSGLSILYAN